MLLNCGVDMAFVDKNGFNALHIAASAGFVEIVRMILHYQARIKKESKRIKVQQNITPSDKLADAKLVSDRFELLKVPEKSQELTSNTVLVRAKVKRTSQTPQITNATPMFVNRPQSINGTPNDIAINSVA